MSSSYKIVKIKLGEYENRKISIVTLKYCICGFIFNYCIKNNISYFVADISMFVDNLEINPPNSKFTSDIKQARIQKILRQLKNKISDIRRIHIKYSKKV